MALKCPLCGKTYHYESKICQECLNYKEYSKNLSKYMNDGIKLTCASFLSEKDRIFRSNPPKDIISEVKIAQGKDEENLIALEYLISNSVSKEHLFLVYE
jgi:hypothetical protein